MNLLKELFEDHQIGMSQFQDDYLVTSRAGGTLYGQYKQALRELYKRFRALREHTCDYEILLVEIDEIKYKLKQGGLDQFEERKHVIELKRKIMLCEESERVMRDTKREFFRFYQQAVFLKEKVGSLTPEERLKHEKEMWIFRIKEKMVIDLRTTNTLSMNTYEFLMSLPQEIKVKVLDEVRNREKLVEWYENYPKCVIPEDLSSIKLPNMDFLKLEFEEQNINNQGGTQ